MLSSIKGQVITLFILVMLISVGVYIQKSKFYSIPVITDTSGNKNNGGDIPDENSSSESLYDFEGMSSGEKEKLSAEILTDPLLSRDEQDLLKDYLFDKSLDPLIKNNFAGALLSLPQPDPYLHKLFIKIIDDHSQDAVWRDYAVQFLSECMRSTAEPHVVLKKLSDVLKTETSDIKGTAVIQLAIQEADGEIKLGRDFSKNTAEALNSSTVTEGTKMSLIGVVGQRGDTSNLPLIRSIAQSTNSAAIRRVAIAALGKIGQKKDMELFLYALNDPNTGVRMAAEAAIKNFKTRKIVSTKG